MKPDKLKKSDEDIKVVLIAGLRGAGRTLSLRLLEDCGFAGSDNLPPSILPKFIDDSLRHSHDDALVVVAETRTAAAVRELAASVNELRDKPVSLTVIFLEANDTVLLQRLGFKSRKSAEGKSEDIRKILQDNRSRTLPFREKADIVIDTSSVTPASMKERLTAAIEGKSFNRSMHITISSFGHKYAPFAGDLVFDVRFIPNPYYIPELRPLTGKDPACAEYIFQTKEAGIFVETVSSLIKTLIPAYINQGRSSLLIGIGCTGGHHRSVAIAEALGKALRVSVDSITVRHRELA